MAPMVVCGWGPGEFLKSLAYNGWDKSVYPLEWFDSSTERTFANIIDDSEDVDRWLRLQIGDLPILWRNEGRQYHADFVVIENDGTHWVVEVKMDKEVTSEEVVGKRDAARKWANYVNSDPQVDVHWQYLLVSETDIEQSKGHWETLKGFGQS